MLKNIPGTIAMLTVVAGLPLAAPNLSAQAPESSSPDYQRYRVELKLSELDKGKTINTRNYVMVMAKSKGQRSANGRIRVGSRVPYASKAGEFQYQDVGMNIDCSLTPLDGDHAQADLTVDSSGLAGERETVSPTNANPVFRTLRWQGTPAVVIYQIEMTVTEIK